VAAARAFANTRDPPYWREDDMSVSRRLKDGRECWIVTTSEPPGPGEPDWFFSYDGHVNYFIDAETGRCIGQGAGPNRAKHYFPDDNR
jgi:hypothetical protein